MSVETTTKTMRTYLDALLARGDFADYFSEEVTWTTIGTQQTMQGRQPVRDFLIWMHTQAFDAHPKVKTLVVGDGQAALASRSRCRIAWSTTCSTTRSPPCAPTSPWTCSPNSSSERATPASRHRDRTGGPRHRPTTSQGTDALAPTATLQALALEDQRIPMRLGELNVGPAPRHSPGR